MLIDGGVAVADRGESRRHGSQREIARLARVDPTELAGTDLMKLYVFGTDGHDQVNLVASLDNLGKGASGAAVQNMDLMLGLKH